MSDISENPASKHFVIVGGGFTGLAAGYDLTQAGHKVTIVEADTFVGGLAGAFETNGERLDRFYHHWFTNDLDVMKLIEEIGLKDEVVENSTNTGMYFTNKIFKLSTPIDLLRFSPLRFSDRIRLGVLALRARRVSNWRELENETATDWLKKLGGERVYKIVWEPLLVGKFGPYADKISAVWFWNKLKLRGGSRSSGGEERLAYLKGSFARLAETVADKIVNSGGIIKCGSPVKLVQQNADQSWTVAGDWGEVQADEVIMTPALPLVADMISKWADDEYLRELRRIDYLANVCLVLRLDRSLSSTYWLNVNDPNFPFVGVIEHTNFESAETYAGEHIVYLSKYLPHTENLYRMSENEVFDYSLPYLKQMFPEFQRDWVNTFHVWKARWSQPVVEKQYSKLIPAHEGPRKGFHLCSMAQVYPEDRGTNYAIREGRKLAKRIR